MDGSTATEIAERQHTPAAGWLLAVPIFAMTFMGWAYISRRCFAAFYKVHILSAAATIVGVMLHGFGAAITSGIMPLALPGGAFWLLDLVLRATFGSGAPPPGLTQTYMRAPHKPETLAQSHVLAARHQQRCPTLQ